jgi:predicted secreted Zn-dependent protease
MNKKTGILGGLLLALACSASSQFAAGQVYKWTDESGRVHYGPRPPPAVKATSLNHQPSRAAAPEANVVIEESAVKHYPVRGRTPLELHMSMMQNGPFNLIVNKRVYAEIEWRYKWNFDYAREPGKCRIGKFTVTLVTTITMPQWQDEANAPAGTRALWPTVVSKIRRHEDGHKAIGVEGANVLARRLGALPAYDDCQALGAAIRGVGERVVGEYAIAQNAFDRAEALKDSPFKKD